MAGMREELDRALRRRPKHRADRHEDSCGLACDGGWGWIPCTLYLGRHRAEEQAS